MPVLSYTPLWRPREGSSHSMPSQVPLVGGTGPSYRTVPSWAGGEAVLEVEAEGEVAGGEAYEQRMEGPRTLCRTRPARSTGLSVRRGRWHGASRPTSSPLGSCSGSPARRRTPERCLWAAFRVSRSVKADPGKSAPALSTLFLSSSSVSRGARVLSRSFALSLVQSCEEKDNGI